MVDVEKFISTMDDLLNGLSIVFPECIAARQTLAEFNFVIPHNKMMQEKLVAKWVSSMGGLRKACAERNMQQLMEADLAIFKKLKLGEKWLDPTFDAESRHNIWTYIDSLNLHAFGNDENDENDPDATAHMQHITQHVPLSFLEKVAALTSNGDDDADSISLKIANSMSEDELNQLMESLPDIIAELQKTPEGIEAMRRHHSM